VIVTVNVHYTFLPCGFPYAVVTVLLLPLPPLYTVLRCLDYAPRVTAWLYTHAATLFCDAQLLPCIPRVRFRYRSVVPQLFTTPDAVTPATLTGYSCLTCRIWIGLVAHYVLPTVRARTVPYVYAIYALLRSFPVCSYHLPAFCCVTVLLRTRSPRFTRDTFALPLGLRFVTAILILHTLPRGYAARVYPRTRVCRVYLPITAPLFCDTPFVTVTHLRGVIPRYCCCYCTALHLPARWITPFTCYRCSAIRLVPAATIYATTGVTVSVG